MATIESLTGKSADTSAPREVTGSLGGGGISSKVKSEGNTKIFGQETMGKEQFLNLLVTSLQHQDPLDPTSNEDFISQMAQFSALENSTNMVSSMDKLTEGIQTMVDNQNKSSARVSESSAIGLLGHTVRLKQGNFNFDGKLSQVNVHVNAGETSLASISDASGEVVWEGEVPGDGDKLLKWNGLTMDGKKAPAGNYTLKLTSIDGTRVNGYGYAEDKVSGVTYEEGETLLQVGTQNLPYTDILQVVDN